MENGSSERKHHHPRHAVHDTDSGVSELGGGRSCQDEQCQRPSRSQPDDDSDQRSKRDAPGRIHGRIETSPGTAAPGRGERLRADHRDDTEAC